MKPIKQTYPDLRAARRAYSDLKARRWYRTHYNRGGMVRISRFELIDGQLWVHAAGVVIHADMIDTSRDCSVAGYLAEVAAR